MDKILTNVSTLMHYVENQATENNEENIIEPFQSNFSSPTIYVTLFRGSVIVLLALTLIVGVIINYRLLKSVRNEEQGEPGKILQRILETYALVQVICWPCLVLGYTSLVYIMQNYENFLDPCIIINIHHIFMFAFLLVRFFIGLNSLILAVGRYAFVVQHIRMLSFGIKRFGKLLVHSSFFVPVLMSLWASAVMSFEYRFGGSWYAKYANFCPSTYDDDIQTHTANDNDEFQPYTANGMYRSPLYNLMNHYTTPVIRKAFYVGFVIMSSILYLNITEGIIYIKSAIFITR